jgi:hypothetical membrane protein
LSWFKAAGLCGILAPVVAFASITVSIRLSPWFRWEQNALSDLGAKRPSAPFFNTGLIMAGVLVVSFALGLWRVRQPPSRGRTAALLFLLAGVALALIGFLPEPVGRPHLYVSVAFFVLLTLALLAEAATTLMAQGLSHRGLTPLLLAAIAALIWVLPWRGVAIPEAVASAAGSLWVMALGRELASQAPKR